MKSSTVLNTSDPTCRCSHEWYSLAGLPMTCPRCGKRLPNRISPFGLQTDCPATARGEEDPLLNRRLGHYRVTSRLAQGGLGAVYRAVDESLERYVAVKVIDPARLSTNPADYAERLLSAARAHARVSHPNVVQIYYVSLEDDILYLAMELVQGETLAQRLRSERLPFPETVRISLQTCRGLAASERMGITHCEIKPSNLLIAADGTLKLSGFGRSRFADSALQTDLRIDESGSSLPAGDRHSRTHESFLDTFSLGRLLFEMTFGRPPYHVPISAAGSRQTSRQSHSIAFPGDWPEDVPSAWKQLLLRLLSQHPDDRFADYEELFSVLDQFKS